VIFPSSFGTVPENELEKRDNVERNFKFPIVLGIDPVN